MVVPSMAEQQAQLTFCGIIISILYHSSYWYPRANQKPRYGLNGRKMAASLVRNIRALIPSLTPSPSFVFYLSPHVETGELEKPSGLAG
jgi:hypothetical protein